MLCFCVKGLFFPRKDRLYRLGTVFSTTKVVNGSTNLKSYNVDGSEIPFPTNHRLDVYMGGNPKIGGVSPNLDGLQWKTLLKWDDLGGKTPSFGNTYI